MINIKCTHCNHPLELLDLFEASKVMGLHPESVRRKFRYGEVDGIKIERGIYFKESSLGLEWLSKFDESPTLIDVDKKETVTGGE